MAYIHTFLEFSMVKAFELGSICAKKILIFLESSRQELLENVVDGHFGLRSLTECPSLSEHTINSKLINSHIIEPNFAVKCVKKFYNLIF